MKARALSFVCLFLVTAWPAEAVTWNSDGSASDTQAKINSAATGDTVLLPGSGSYTWSAAVSMPNTKAITLDLNVRTITISGASGRFTINSPTSGSAVNRVTNGDVVRGSGFNAFLGTFQILDTRTGAGVRVDHIDFTGADVLIDLNAQGKGVMDHCTFSGLGWAQEFLHILGWGDSNTTGWTTDTGASLLGSGDIFYIENCSFTRPAVDETGVAWIEAFYGSRFAIRYCAFDMVSLDTHGGGGVGCRLFDIAHCTFDNSDITNGQPQWALSARAGSGVVHDNSMLGGADHAVDVGFCWEAAGDPENTDYRPGRGLNSGSDPVYVWSNGTIDLVVNDCDASDRGGLTEGVDVIASSRPGYIEYTYPHPLQGARKQFPGGNIFLVSGSDPLSFFEGTLSAVFDDPNVDLLRVRIGWSDIQPTSAGSYTWTRFDNALAVCAAHGKKLGVSITSGRNGTPDWEDSPKFAISPDDPDGAGFQPIPWNAVYKARWQTFVNAFAAHCDSNPALAYVVITGFMQNNEMFIAKVPSDDIAWNDQAIADGCTDSPVGRAKTNCLLPAAAEIIGYFETAFVETPCILTLARPWDDNSIGNQDKNSINNAAHDAYPNWYGESIASVKAVLDAPDPVPLVVGYPKIGQAISQSSDEDRFYATPPDPYPDRANRIDDFVKNGAAQGRTGLEIWPEDINDATTGPVLAADKVFLLANLPPFTPPLNPPANIIVRRK